MAIGTNLKKILEENNIKVSDLAQETRIAPQTIYAIINRDNKTVKPDILKNIAKGITTLNKEIAMNIALKQLRNYDSTNTLAEAIYRENRDEAMDIVMKEMNEIEDKLKNGDTITVKTGSSEYTIELKEPLRNLIEYYNQLNEKGIKKAVESIELLTKISEYRKDN